MPITVSLDDILEGIELASDYATYYLNKKTGKMTMITEDTANAIENDEPTDELHDWQLEEIKIAKKVFAEMDNHITLPSKYDIHEYRIMERSCSLISDEKTRDLMFNSLQGSGAFRRFKNNIIILNIEDDWYEYRSDAFRDFAIEWCKYNGINYIDYKD